MGVKDISTLIKRSAPSAVTYLTGPLTHFTGKTLAIDANLLTNKFFHAEMNNLDEQLSPYATIKPWYRFLRALERDNIKPIVVFDGDSRLLAKAAEVRRRVAARRLQRDRGKAETDRSSRLSELTDVWAGGREGFTDRVAVIEAFRGIVKTGERVHQIEEKDQVDEIGEQFEQLEVEDDRGVVETGGKTERIQRVEQLDENDQATLKQMIELHGAFKADESNPIYSANQRKITAVERSFYDYDEGIDEDDSLMLLEEGRLQSSHLRDSHHKRSLSLPSTSLTAVQVSRTVSSLCDTALIVICRTSLTPWEYHGSSRRSKIPTKRKRFARNYIRLVWQTLSSRKTRTSLSTVRHYYDV